MLLNLKTAGLNFLAIAIAFCFACDLRAGFFVGNNAGAGGGNDTLAKVLEEIDEYNLANNPDLIDPTGLFKKTDDDEPFVFDMANGFMFFEDAAGTVPILTVGGLTSRAEAYFKYTGTDANILYYSVKGPQNFGFSLFTFMSGLNHLDLVGDDSNISHVSFWEGPPVPEPSTIALALLGFGLLASRRNK